MTKMKSVPEPKTPPPPPREATIQLKGRQGGKNTEMILSLQQELEELRSKTEIFRDALLFIGAGDASSLSAAEVIARHALYSVDENEVK